MATTTERIAEVDKILRTFPDFPKPGINFVDIFPMMKHPAVFNECVDLLVEHIREKCPDVEVIIGLDSRGFIFGPLIAQKLGIAFSPVRKAGKLPGETVKASFTKEYGKDVFEAQVDAVEPGQKVVIVDDLLATGGTMAAACQLLSEIKSDILECIVVIELTELNGRKIIPNKVFSLIQRTD